MKFTPLGLQYSESSEFKNKTTIIIHHFSVPGRAISLTSVCVSGLRNEMTFRYLACRKNIAAVISATFSKSFLVSCFSCSMLDTKYLLYTQHIKFTRFGLQYVCTFSALTLLVGRQEGHPACKNRVGGVLAWLSVWSEVQTCIWPS